MKLTELKNAIFKMKFLLKAIKSRLRTTKENEFAYMLSESQYRENKKKKLSLSDL